MGKNALFLLGHGWTVPCHPDSSRLAGQGTFLCASVIRREGKHSSHARGPCVALPSAHAFMKISISCLFLVFFKYQAFYAYGKLTIYLQQTLNKQTKKADHTAEKCLPPGRIYCCSPCCSSLPSSHTH